MPTPWLSALALGRLRSRGPFLYVLLLTLGASALPARAGGQGPSTLRIAVTDEAGEPVVSARVLLQPGRYRGVTDQAGEVRFGGLDSGDHLLQVERSGYQRHRSAIHLRAGAIAPLTVTLRADPIPLERIEVVSSEISRLDPLAGFYDRRERGVTGHFFTEHDLKRMRIAHLGDLIRHVPGIQVIPLRGGQVALATGRGVVNVGCNVQVYMDGIRYRSVAVENVVMDDMEGVEVYTGMQVPPEFADPESRCGVVALWSKRYRPNRQ